MTNPWIEADIVVNGRRLTFAESMTLRVALTTFHMQVSDEEYQEIIGIDLSRGYRHHAESVLQTIFKKNL